MLDALATVLLEILGDLAAVVGGLVQRDADPAVRAGHGLGMQAGQPALDVEMADLAEAEQPLVEAGPMLQPALVDIVGEVVDAGEADPLHVRLRRLHEVDVVDAVSAIAVDQVEGAAADADDGGNVQLHRPRLAGVRPGAPLQRPAVGGARVADPEGHGAGAGAVRIGKALSRAVRLAVQDEVDVALAEVQHVLGPVPPDGAKAHGLEHVREGSGVGGGELDELEAVGAHRIAVHAAPLRC
jgi:hypothetical protein